MISACFAVILALLLTALTTLRIYFKSTSWCKSQTCLVNKTAIVTGANTGIGWCVAADLAKRGARVILACRNGQKAEEARLKIIKETGNNNVVVKLVNFSRFQSVRDFAKDINETESHLNILVNNAAVIDSNNETSKDGHSLTAQVNYYSPFLLTILLLNLLRRSGPSRIVNVSSSIAKFVNNFSAEELDKFPGALSAYALSKLCNILFTRELHKRVENSGVTVYSVHPGEVDTDIFKCHPGPMKYVADWWKRMILKSQEEGAQSVIHCAVAKGIEECSGQHFKNCKRVEPYQTAMVPGRSTQLWEFTENMFENIPTISHKL